MKKHLLSLALLAAVAVPFNTNAQATLETVWQTYYEDPGNDWNGADPDWTSTDAIKPTGCMRFAHGRDGRIYTVNMRTMSIAEITKDGVSDLYKLPALEGNDYYGTAISMDDCGNFLIGHYFVKRPESSQYWTVYVPTTGEAFHFNLGYPNDMAPEDYNDGGLTTKTGIGRIDCVGRVIGDLTGESVFFIAPEGQGGGSAQNVRAVYSFGNGGGDLTDLSFDGTEYTGTYLGFSGGQNICQPWITSVEQYGETFREHMGAYVICSTCGGYKYDVINVNWTAPASIKVPAEAMQASWRALGEGNLTCNNGFDTFELNGHRYFVHSYSRVIDSNNMRPIDFAVFDETGTPVAEWTCPAYKTNGGYNSIVAQPMEDGTALIHVHAFSGANTAAAVVKFTPQSDDDMLGSETNPLVINTVEDFVALPNKCRANTMTYVRLDADLDFEGVEYKVLFNETAAQGKPVSFDGNNHIIKNIKGAEGVAQNGSVFGSFQGAIKNLGVENIDVNINWFCCGGLVGAIVGDTEISNCYVTGSVQGAASGGMVGAVNAGKLTITNSYAQVNTGDNVGGHSAGLVGRVDPTASLEINNAYANGTVKAINYAAGIVNVNTEKGVTLNNVIAWNPTVTGGTAGAVYTTTAGQTVTTTNVLVYDAMLVNNEAVTDGAPNSTLQQTATSWEAYKNGLYNGFAVLEWQDVEVTGIDDITVDAGDAAAEYFNLQGIRVANPEAGAIYIVRRGNSVSKIVR